MSVEIWFEAENEANLCDSNKRVQVKRVWTKSLEDKYFLNELEINSS